MRWVDGVAGHGDFMVIRSEGLLRAVGRITFRCAASAGFAEQLLDGLIENAAWAVFRDFPVRACFLNNLPRSVSVRGMWLFC